MFGSLTFIWSEEPKPPSSRPRLPEKQAGRRVSEISSGLLPSGQLFKAFVGATLVHTAARRRLIFGLATPEWCDRLIQLESVGGRAHEAQYIRFVWSGDGAAYRNGGVVAFSRYTFASGIGNLRCYGTGAIEKPCEQPPLIARVSARRAPSD